MVPADSRTGRFIIDYGSIHIKEKARESVPVTRPAIRGLRIAHTSLNEQRRDSPRRYV